LTCEFSKFITFTIWCFLPYPVSACTISEFERLSFVDTTSWLFVQVGCSKNHRNRSWYDYLKHYEPRFLISGRGYEKHTALLKVFALHIFTKDFPPWNFKRNCSFVDTTSWLFVQVEGFEDHRSRSWYDYLKQCEPRFLIRRRGYEKHTALLKVFALHIFTKDFPPWNFKGNCSF